MREDAVDCFEGDEGEIGANTDKKRAPDGRWRPVVMAADPMPVVVFAVRMAVVAMPIVPFPLGALRGPIFAVAIVAVTIVASMIVAESSTVVVTVLCHRG
jgi:hypothetical protein